MKKLASKAERVESARKGGNRQTKAQINQANRAKMAQVAAACKMA